MISPKITNLGYSNLWTDMSTILGYASSFTKQIQKLFANGEQGFWYDPNDLTTLYQDATGTVPVTAEGQPVGLMLDKSKGSGSGSNLVRNGDFSGGATSWVARTNTQLSIVNGRLRVSAIASGIGYGVDSTLVSATEASKLYRFSAEVYRTNTSNVVYVRGASNTASIRNTSFNNIEIGASSSLAFVVSQIGAVAGEYFEIDNVSIKELVGDHANQATSAARPILRQIPILGVNVLPNFDFTTWGKAGTGTTATTNSFNITDLVGGIRLSDAFEVGKTYRVKSKATTTASQLFFVNSIGGLTPLIASSSNGIIDTIYTATNSSLYLRTGSGETTVTELEIREVIGYHANQYYVAFDGVDDKLVTNLTTPLTNATVLRAIPNVGTQVKYNQTLPMLYEDSTNHAGLFAIDRALTYQEQLGLMVELDKRAGVESLESSVINLFDANQVGFVYDPNDLSTMFQNAAGTIAVTDVGQPVGLVLDKSKQLQRGVNLTENFDFRTWGGLGGVTVDKTSFTATIAGGITSNVGMVVGKMYKIDIEYTSTNPSSSVALLNGNHGATPLLQSTTSGKISCYCLAANGLLYLRSTNATVTVTKFVIQEVLGNHAYQSTSASRPILRKNAETGANYLEFDGSDDFLQTNSIDFTMTDKVSLFAGVRKLSDAATGAVCELSTIADTSKSSFVLLAPASSGSNHYNFRSFGSGGSVTGTSIVQDFPAPHSAILRATGEISTNTCELAINGGYKQSTPVSQGTGNYGNYPLYIGRRGGTSLPFNGHLYSLIGIGKLVPESDVKRIEQGIANFLGVTLNV